MGRPTNRGSNAKVWEIPGRHLARHSRSSDQPSTGNRQESLARMEYRRARNPGWSTNIPPLVQNSPLRRLEQVAPQPLSAIYRISNNQYTCKHRGRCRFDRNHKGVSLACRQRSYPSPFGPPPSPTGTYEDISLGLTDEEVNSIPAKEEQKPLPPAAHALKLDEP